MDKQLLDLMKLTRSAFALFPCWMLAAVCVASMSSGAASAAPAGDRGTDVNATFPDTLFIQNGGPVYNVKNPPEGQKAAVGDGVADDTAAFRDAYDYIKALYVKHGPWGSAHRRYIYIPNGTYKVTDTLIYRGATIGSTDWGKSRDFDINRIKLIGQSRAGTIIKLADNCPGYGDGNSPKVVVATQHLDTVFNNVPGSNWIRNITIDTGSGNPGAIALFMQGANNSHLQNVTIRSGDGAGKYGIWHKIGSVQGYYCDVTVEGFDYGIYSIKNAEICPAYEYLTLKNQRVCGIYHGGGVMVLRKVLSDQTATGVTAYKADRVGGLGIMIDSVLKGGKEANPAMELTRNADQCLLARNVNTEGYGMAVRKAGEAVVEAGTIDEYTSYKPVALFPDQKLETLRLPIEDTPLIPWYDPEKWAVVDDYPNVQAAFDSGKPVICLKKRTYEFGDIKVPASVKVVNGMAANSRGTLVISEASEEPLLVLDAPFSIRIKANRTIIQRCSGGGVSNPDGLPVTIFLENVNDNATGDNFCKPGSKVYARQIDIEYANAEQIIVNGGMMWVFGFKTERDNSYPFTAKNGGYLEILGGYGNFFGHWSKTSRPSVRNFNSNVSASLMSNLGAPKGTMIEETRGDVTKSMKSTELPARGVSGGGDRVIPLYCGWTKRYEEK